MFALTHFVLVIVARLILIVEGWIRGQVYVNKTWAKIWLT